MNRKNWWDWLWPRSIVLTIVPLLGCYENFAYDDDGGSIHPIMSLDSSADDDALQNDADASASEIDVDAGTNDASNGDACVSENGSKACSDVIASYCARRAQCFGDDIQTCVADCKAMSMGILDCSKPVYANMTVCSDSASKCIAYMGSASCVNINSCGTVGKDCNDFWSQFVSLQ